MLCEGVGRGAVEESSYENKFCDILCVVPVLVSIGPSSLKEVDLTGARSVAELHVVKGLRNLHLLGIAESARARERGGGGGS